MLSLTIHNGDWRLGILNLETRYLVSTGIKYWLETRSLVIILYSKRSLVSRPPQDKILLTLLDDDTKLHISGWEEIYFNLDSLAILQRRNIILPAVTWKQLPPSMFYFSAFYIRPLYLLLMINASIKCRFLLYGVIIFLQLMGWKFLIVSQKAIYKCCLTTFCLRIAGFSSSLVCLSVLSVCHW